MKYKKRQFRAVDERISHNQRVRVEMESFLKAISSYSQRFATDPQITFEKHHSYLVQAAGTESRRRA
jgi:hypothetical protein